MEKKEVSVNTVVKSIITGFASYGIIFYISVLLILVIAGRLTANVSSLKNENIKIVISVIFAVLCFIIVRFTCRVSTMDVFKKCIMNPESNMRVGKKMTLFYVICVILCMFTGLMLLNLNLKYARAEIAYYRVFNSQVFSQELVDMKEQEMNAKYDVDKDYMVKTSVIVEIGLVLGFLSLINYQGKMLEKYNEYMKAKVIQGTDEKNDGNTLNSDVGDNINFEN